MKIQPLSAFLNGFQVCKISDSFENLLREKINKKILCLKSTLKRYFKIPNAPLVTLL